MIDLRSDTVTKPTNAMKEFMMNSEVGDDVFGEDPTVNELEKLSASMFGMEAGIFCPSGTMTNQIAIKVHTQPGDEVICDALSHVYQYEGGGIAFNSLCATKLLTGNKGRIHSAQIKTAINNRLDVHKPISKLVCIENTSNRGGGSCYDLDELKQIKLCCSENNLLLHLDGARLFNALVATGQHALDYGKIFDSISICLSKGLGAPVGSVLLGSHSFIQNARRVRKLFGGGMRQAGVIAGAGIFALNHHIGRLQEDHEHAAMLAQALATSRFVDTVAAPETNIVLFTTKPDVETKRVLEAFKKEGILCLAIDNHTIRMVTHLNISREMIVQAIESIHKLSINRLN